MDSETFSGTSSIPGWASIRKRILERDNYACRICKKDGAEAKLNVHHIDWDRSNNSDDNFVTLCTNCHRAIHKEGYKPELFEDWPIPWQ
jgi:5-methylcytosine-specific restriction endonuclease McrA